MVERVEVIPSDYKEMKLHIHQLIDELEVLQSRPARIETRVERVEVKPTDYDYLKS